MHDEANSEVRNALLIAGGVALMAFGAGLILSHPSVRRTVMAGLSPLLPDVKDPMHTGLSGLLPDVERYMRIKAM